MYSKIFYSDSFFQLFVMPIFTYEKFNQHKNMVIDTFIKYSNKEIDKYPHGFWYDTTGLINTRIILYLIIYCM